MERGEHSSRGIPRPAVPRPAVRRPLSVAPLALATSRVGFGRARQDPDRMQPAAVSSRDVTGRTCRHTSRPIASQARDTAETPILDAALPLRLPGTGSRRDAAAGQRGEVHGGAGLTPDHMVIPEPPPIGPGGETSPHAQVRLVLSSRPREPCGCLLK